MIPFGHKRFLPVGSDNLHWVSYPFWQPLLVSDPVTPFGQQPLLVGSNLFWLAVTPIG